jgi:catechol 2,3-dioxygenase-like lactoylglutathione lyase family enzyme
MSAGSSNTSIDPQAQVRIARPSLDLEAAERFYVDGLGLTRLYRGYGTSGHADNDLLMLGWAESNWHLELTRSVDEPIAPTPTVDDLLVIYLDGTVPGVLVERLVSAGGIVVPAHNPYWDEWGVTIQDPDGYRLVLCTRSWSNRR